MTWPTREEQEQRDREDFLRRQEERRRELEEAERRERERHSPGRTPGNYNDDPRIWGC